MSHKPVPEGGTHTPHEKGHKRSQSVKTQDWQKLKAKGVSTAKAKEVTGSGEDITQDEAARRRIAWQQTLSKGSI